MLVFTHKPTAQVNYGYVTVTVVVMMVMIVMVMVVIKITDEVNMDYRLHVNIIVGKKKN